MTPNGACEKLMDDRELPGFQLLLPTSHRLLLILVFRAVCGCISSPAECHGSAHISSAILQERPPRCLMVTAEWGLLQLLSLPGLLRLDPLRHRAKMCQELVLMRAALLGLF